jgi:hypothetical protein
MKRNKGDYTDQQKPKRLLKKKSRDKAGQAGNTGKA